MNSTEVSPSSAEIKEIFDRIAPVYDRLNDSLSLGQHRIWKLMAVKWAEPKLGAKVLDICCGSGDLTVLLAKNVGKEGKAIGLDFSKEQLAIAKNRNFRYAIDWIEGDALNLPFDDNYFDCITMGYGLRNVVNISQCLREVYRVLKPGKKAAILDFHRPNNGIINNFQQWYLDNIVVPMARNLGLTEEYAYISPSLDRFPTGEEQIKLGKNAGFTKAVHYPIANGMMGVLVLNK
ncbi:MAG: bifunctional demethylmenaquinone methyltransferase/2-methoxy-6-polyprenyl-1,4-benzoquinol methylase UbiE [Prochloraceae cyanobacterium]